MIDSVYCCRSKYDFSGKDSELNEDRHHISDSFADFDSHSLAPLVATTNDRGVEFYNNLHRMSQDLSRDACNCG